MKWYFKLKQDKLYCYGVDYCSNGSGGRAGQGICMLLVISCHNYVAEVALLVMEERGWFMHKEDMNEMVSLLKAVD